jgi:DNA-binding response OmpR family regulator
MSSASDPKGIPRLGSGDPHAITSSWGTVQNRQRCPSEANGAGVIPMDRHTVLIVEGEILARHPLAEYLRECGFRVVEAVTPEEAHLFLSQDEGRVDVMLADVSASGGADFNLGRWVREHRPGVRVLLVGSISGAAKEAGGLCDEESSVSKPYDHQLVENRIRRLLAERDNNRRPDRKMTAA